MIRYAIHTMWKKIRKLATFTSAPFSLSASRQFTLLILLGWGSSGFLYSQEVEVEVSYDTIYVGNILGVRYTMSNWQADMDQPDFGDFEAVGGPQISSSMSIRGGQRSSSKTVTMFLRPPDRPGPYTLPPVLFKGENKEAQTKEIIVWVLENPDGIRQEPAFERKPPRAYDRQYQRSEPPRGKRQRF